MASGPRQNHVASAFPHRSEGDSSISEGERSCLSSLAKRSRSTRKADEPSQYLAYSVASYKDRTKCVDARRLEDAKGPDLDDVLSGEPSPRPPRRPASPNRRGRRGGEQKRQVSSAPVTGNTMTPEQHQQLMYYYAYQQQYAYPYVQPMYDPAQMMGAYYAYPQYYQPGNPGFPQPLAPIDRESAEAMAEASAAAAAEKDAAPGEPEEGTPKLKPRADTFDGPAL